MREVLYTVYITRARQRIVRDVMKLRCYGNGYMCPLCELYHVTRMVGMYMYCERTCFRERPSPAWRLRVHIYYEIYLLYQKRVFVLTPSLHLRVGLNYYESSVPLIGHIHKTYTIHYIFIHFSLSFFYYLFPSILSDSRSALFLPLTSLCLIPLSSINFLHFFSHLDLPSPVIPFLSISSRQFFY